MPKISESIFSGKTVIIPMADIQHIEKKFLTHDREGVGKAGDVCNYNVITKHTTWNTEIDSYNNSIWLSLDEGKRLLDAWLYLRHEIDGPFKGPED